MVGQIGHIMVTVADTMMVGQLGVIPLAAATFAGTFYHILMLFGIGVSYGLTPLVAATDLQDKPKLLKLLQNSLLVNSVLGLLMFGLVISISPFLGYFGQEEQVAISAKPYLQVICFSLIPLMLFQTFRQFSEGLSDTFNPMVVSILANLLNVGLNYLFIFGKWGFPEMGLVGAGYATVISRVVMVVLMMGLSRDKWKGFQMRFEQLLIKRMIKIGVPSGMQYVFEIGAFAMAAIMVGWLGAESLAAHQIALNLAAVSYMAATGIASASTIRIGNQMGLKDLKTLKTAGNTSFVLVAGFMAFCGLIFIFFRFQLTDLYIDNEKVQSLAATLLVIAAAFQISDGLQAVGLGVLRGLTDVKVPTLVTFFAYWMVAIPGSYLLGFTLQLGVIGVWYALLVGLSIAAVLHFMRFQNKVKKIRF